MGGCCRGQQLAIRWKKQLSLKSMKILKLFQNRVLIKKENSNITKYICIPNNMKLFLANFFSLFKIRYILSFLIGLYWFIMIKQKTFPKQLFG